jgi:uncharacterized protein
VSGTPAGPGSIDREVALLAQALRRAGIRVGTGQAVTCRRALRILGTGLTARYWAGRTTLVTDPRDLVVYDRVFRTLGSIEAGEPALPPPPDEVEVATAGSDRTGRPGRTGELVMAGAVASERERLRHRRFDQATPDELAEIAQLLQRLELAIPQGVARRTRRSHRGDLDLPRTLERALAADGELIDRVWRRRRERPRRLVLVLDVSGSMAPYARALLRFGVVARRAALRVASHRVEIFAFGTRLTRLSDDLAARDPDAAIAAAARRVTDWDGGTRIGASLDELVRTWGRRGVLRGSVLVVCSDGLERGDHVALAAAVARLRRHVHRLVWVNPLAGAAGYEPTQRGMAAALPHVDVFLPGHDLASLEALVEVIARLR